MLEIKVLIFSEYFYNTIIMVQLIQWYLSVVISGDFDKYLPWNQCNKLLLKKHINISVVSLDIDLWALNNPVQCYEAFSKNSMSFLLIHSITVACGVIRNDATENILWVLKNLPRIYIYIFTDHLKIKDLFSHFIRSRKQKNKSEIKICFFSLTWYTLKEMEHKQK